MVVVCTYLHLMRTFLPRRSLHVISIMAGRKEENSRYFLVPHFTHHTSSQRTRSSLLVCVCACVRPAWHLSAGLSSGCFCGRTLCSRYGELGFINACCFHSVPNCNTECTPCAGRWTSRLLKYCCLSAEAKPCRDCL